MSLLRTIAGCEVLVRKGAAAIRKWLDDFDLRLPSPCVASVAGSREPLVGDGELGPILGLDGLVQTVEIGIDTLEHLSDGHAVPLRRCILDVYDGLLNFHNRFPDLLHLIGRQFPIGGMARKPKLDVMHLHRLVHQIGKMRKISFAIWLLSVPWRRIESYKQASGAGEPEKRHEYECPFDSALHAGVSLTSHTVRSHVAVVPQRRVSRGDEVTELGGEVNWPINRIIAAVYQPHRITGFVLVLPLPMILLLVKELVRVPTQNSKTTINPGVSPAFRVLSRDTRHRRAQADAAALTAESRGHYAVENAHQVFCLGGEWHGQGLLRSGQASAQAFDLRLVCP